MKEKRKPPIDYRKYPLRVCRTLHKCKACGKNIEMGAEYYDGGYERRAHKLCATLWTVMNVLVEEEKGS